jgi:hypothetical protein
LANISGRWRWRLELLFPDASAPISEPAIPGFSSFPLKDGVATFSSWER